MKLAKRIVLLLRPENIDKNLENEIKKKEKSDEVYRLVSQDPNAGKIVTLDTGKIQDAIFLPVEYDEDGFEDVHHDYLLMLLEEKHNLPKDSLFFRESVDSNIKLGFVTTYRDNAFIFHCIHTNVNEVKDLILKYCQNIQNVYDDMHKQCKSKLYTTFNSI